MKKLSFLLIIFLVFVGGQVLAAEESGVGLLFANQSKQEVEKKIGRPIKETQRDGILVWWYVSIDPFSADFAYFRGDKLVMQSTSRKDTQESLGQYISKYGQPESSIYKYKENEEDPAQMTMHQWATQAIAVQTAGFDVSSPVLRDFHFPSTTVGDFFQRLAPDLIGNQPVVVTGVVASLAGQNTPEKEIVKQLTALSNDNRLGLVIVLALSVILLLVVVLYHKRPRHIS